MTIDHDTALQLAGYVQRIEDHEADKGKAADGIKDEYAAAGAAGFDKKALRQIIKRRKADSSASVRLRATVDTYMAALATFETTELGQWASAWRAEQRTVEASVDPLASRPAKPATSTAADDKPKLDPDERSALEADVMRRRADKYIKPSKPH